MKLKLLIALLVLGVRARADVRLPAVLASHMVLQQNTLVNFWGWSEPGEKISIKVPWDTTTYHAIGSGNAQWSVQLHTPAAGGPFRMTITGSNELVLDDVLVGEVWLCSGQSNMEMSVSWGLPYATESAAATNTQIRFFHIPRTTAAYPQEDLHARWVVCTPEAMRNFSAAGYFFGQQLQSTLKCPVGLISAAWSGTPAEVWIPADTILQDSVLGPAATRLTPAEGWPIRPGATFNAMIYPLLNYPIAGAIWYQGESNVGMGDTYRPLITNLIRTWRRLWNKELPFYYVQIAPYAGYSDNASAFLREAQAQAADLPNTGMVVTTDLVDDLNDIHPKMKKEVGLRLANYALVQTYGITGIPYRSPEFQSMTIEKNRIRIRLAHAEKGLVSRGGPLKEFYVAGENRRFVPAQAKIEGQTVVVWSPEVSKPVAVRFAFRDAPQPNLFSVEGLPVIPFRKEHWVTAQE